MATTFPLTTLAAVVSSTGVAAPSYVDILTSLKTSFRLIYGEDAYLEADSQDGQWVAIIAQSIYDCNQAVIAAYNSFSPATAFGEALSNVVKINHMARSIATHSQVNLTVGGQAGTTLQNAVAADAEGNRWLLPSSVVIPPAGTVIVTATAEAAGAVSAPVHTVTQIATPTAGWQSVTNDTAASLGQPVESDGELRARQELSPAINSYTVIGAMAAAIKALPGVTYGTIYENDTNTTDSNGLPAHSVALVVKGGVAADIAQTLFEKKAPGVATYGSTTVNVTDVSGTARPINFSVPTEVPVKVAITLAAGVGYTTAIASAIKAAVVNHINALEIGEDVVVSRIYSPALLQGAVESETYKINVLQAALAPSGTLATTDIVIAFTAKATCQVSDVTITTV